ncbi:MAG: glucans biosynthesis glucosyltransferase MdoH [Pseudomonadota bacterium]
MTQIADARLHDEMMRTAGDTAVRSHAPTLPADHPMDMPVQDLWDGRRRPTRSSQLGISIWLWTIASRIMLIAITLALSGGFAWGLYDVLQPSQSFPLLIALITFSTVCFAWVAFGSAMAIVGAVNLMLRGDADTLDLPADPITLTSRNALLFPVYHEDPSDVRATIDAICDQLVLRGDADAFDVFVLSDTRTPDAVKYERAVFQSGTNRFGGLKLYYRNRSENSGKKAGNIAEWVTRFGRAYDHFVILDADSVMSGETLVRLAAAMEKHPMAGLIQTVPRLIGSQTLFARLQQFAHGVYGPVIAAGYAAWQGASGNYWGHNAIIRTEAFAQSAGLPTLNGPPPFGGPIQSHDFVEAAMLRRAGWGVHMVPSADGSFERCPPTLIDMAIRDRRWAQGNLQHARVIGAPGLPLVSRIHMGLGIFAYLASAFWCLALLIGLWLTAATQGQVPSYFPTDTQTLFPQWPVYDPQAALQLLLLTAFVILLPKVIGILFAVIESVQRGDKRSGDIVTGGVVEILMSMLLAPVMMATQIRSVLEIFIGRDSGWSAQNRTSGAPSLHELWVFHRWHVLIGLSLAWSCWSLSWYVVAWMSPIIVGLVLSPWLSWWTAGRAGAGFDRHLATHEDVTTPRIVTRVLELTSVVRDRDTAKG